MCELIMRDSNNFHSICMDTYPPIFYLNEFSHAVIDLVHKFNAHSDTKIAYTFDAGPHAVLFIPNTVLKDVVLLIHRVFDMDLNAYNENGQKYLESIDKTFDNEHLNELIN